MGTSLWKCRHVIFHQNVAGVILKPTHLMSIRQSGFSGTSFLNGPLMASKYSIIFRLNQTLPILLTQFRIFFQLRHRFLLARAKKNLHVVTLRISQLLWGNWTRLHPYSKLLIPEKEYENCSSIKNYEIIKVNEFEIRFPMNVSGLPPKYRTMGSRRR